MPKKAEKETRIMRVSLPPEQFEKFDKGETHSDNGIRTKDGKLSALPDIETIDPVELQRTPTREENEREFQKLLERERILQEETHLTQNQIQLKKEEKAARLAKSAENFSEFMLENPELTYSAIQTVRKAINKASGLIRSGISAVKSRLPKNKSQENDSDVVLDSVAYQYEFGDEDQTSFEVSAETGQRVIENMREEAKRLTYMIYIVSHMTIKDGQSNSKYVMEESVLRELLTEDVRNTMKTLVANKHLLDTGTAQTLSDFLDGYFTNGDKRIPIPVMLDESTPIYEEMES